MLGLAALGGIATVVVACWRQVLSVVQTLQRAVMLSTPLVDYEIRHALLAYLRAHAYSVPSLTPIQWTFRLMHKTTFTTREYLVENLRQRTLWIYKGRPIWVHRSADNNDALSCIRGTINVTRLLTRALDWFSDLNHKRTNGVSCRYAIHVLGGNEPASTGSVGGSSANINFMLAGDPRRDAEFIHYDYNKENFVAATNIAANIDDMALTDAHRSVVSEIEKFIERGPWYRERGLAWKRGYLLEGPPGNGKSRFVRSLAQHFDLPIVVVRPGVISDATLNDCMTHHMSAEHPTILLIEDIDAVYDSERRLKNSMFGMMGPMRSTRSTANATAPDGKVASTDDRNFGMGGIPFDTLLNTIDGVDASKAFLLFVTTNHPDKVDPAIGGGGKPRPGRIDRIVQFNPPTAEGRRKIIARILIDEPAEVIDGLVVSTDGASGAITQEAAIHYVLEKINRIVSTN